MVKIWTRLRATGPLDRIEAFAGRVRPHLDPVPRADLARPGTYHVFCSVEVDRLEWAIGRARECGLDAREDVAGKGGGR